MQTLRTFAFVIASSSTAPALAGWAPTLAWCAKHPTFVNLCGKPTALQNQLPGAAFCRVDGDLTFEVQFAANGSVNDLNPLAGMPHPDQHLTWDTSGRSVRVFMWMGSRYVGVARSFTALGGDDELLGLRDDATDEVYDLCGR